MFFIRLRNRKANRMTNTAIQHNERCVFKTRWTKGVFWAQSIHKRAMSVFWVHLCGKHLVYSESFHSKALSPHRKVWFQPGCFFFPNWKRMPSASHTSPVFSRGWLELTLIPGPCCMANTPSWKHNDIDIELCNYKVSYLFPNMIIKIWHSCKKKKIS